jgi:hypothetical protein
MGFISAFNERVAIRKQFLDPDGHLRDDAEVLYASEDGAVVRCNTVTVSIWSNGDMYVELHKPL